MIKKITIIDYGAGNIFKLLNSFKRLNCEVNVASNEKEITKSDRLIIPGVGALKITPMYVKKS